MKRYDQCDVTCTVDCGHCKGVGPPITCTADPCFTYTVNDDGIWMCCDSCDFDECLGFFPNLTIVLDAAGRHKSGIQ